MILFVIELFCILINSGKYTNLSIHVLDSVKAQTTIDVGKLKWMHI